MSKQSQSWHIGESEMPLIAGRMSPSQDEDQEQAIWSITLITFRNIVL